MESVEDVDEAGVFEFCKGAARNAPEPIVHPLPAEFYETVGMIFRCPGCRAVSFARFAGRGKPVEGPRWRWDGNLQQPSLEPSIHHATERGGCGWHGHLVAGMWRPC